MAGLLNQIVKQIFDHTKTTAPKTTYPKNTTIKVKPVEKSSANDWVMNSTISNPMSSDLPASEEKTESDASVNRSMQIEEISVVEMPAPEISEVKSFERMTDDFDIMVDTLTKKSDVSDDKMDLPKVEIVIETEPSKTEIPITAIDRSRRRERTQIDVEKEDYLLSQIDEFRAKAQQLQELLLSKESKVNELQTIVDEREIKAKELEHILNERQRKADGITAEVAMQIDNLIEKVSAKMEEIGTSIGADLENGQKLSEEQMAQLRETLESLTEQLDTIKAELSDKVHSENVKCYRNIADLFKSMDEKMDVVKKENQFILQKADSIHKSTIVLIVLSVLNMVGVVVSVLLGMGVFR